LLVDFLHLGEVLRRLRLPREHGTRELVLVLDGEGPVEHALVADGALRNRAEPLAARRTRAVAGPDLEIVRLLLEFLELRNKVRAAASMVPLTPAAFSSRSGRPTSPTKMKSPVIAPIGLSAPAVSVTRKVRCSGVCPGVWSTSIFMFPTMKVYPSSRSTAPASSAKAYFQFSSPSSER
jgi:hypothetical protein